MARSGYLQLSWGETRGDPATSRELVEIGVWVSCVGGGCCAAGAGPPKRCSPLPSRRAGASKEGAIPPSALGAPGLGELCGGGARGDANGKRYGRKRLSGWDINQAEYMGS